MKKNNLLLLTSFSMLLTGCLGTKYTWKNEESDNTKTINETSTLSLSGKDKGEGNFTLVEKVNNTYSDGYFKGVFGVGKVNGEVTHKQNVKKTGTWTKLSDTKVELTILKVVVSVDVTGEGEDDYEDLLEASFAVLYGKEKADDLLDGETLTFEYTVEDNVKERLSINDATKTFEY